MGRTGRIVASSVAVALLAGVVWAVLVLTREPAPASVDEAVAAFRAGLDGRAPTESPAPEGVYVYATDGYERTDALTGVTNEYPERSTITVTTHGCGFRMRWDVLEGRSTTWTICTGGDGWTLASQDERHTFFGRTERTTYTCEETPFRPEGDSPGVSIAYRCTTPASQERGRSVVVGRELVPFGGMEVDAMHVRRVSALTGATRGRTRHDLWLNRETGIPVRLAMTTRTANDAPVGEVRYEEDVVLELESLDPLR
jgi:hypothetical protein